MNEGLEVFIYTVVALVALGGLAAVILYFVSQKFKVYEDPRIDTTEALLPGANCGGCGFPGCRGLASALVENDDISSLFCPVGGAATMKAVAEHLGKAAPEREPQVAVLKCSGSCAKRPKTSQYDGASTCAILSSLYGGETDCTFGCLGKGDCVSVCSFGAISINPETGLPVIDDEKCTACGACAKACPKMLIELRKKGAKGRKIYVGCSSKDKGAVARKACAAACIGCGKCVKTCPFGAITLENNVAYIDASVCKMCRKCVAECPTGAIIEYGFPPKKPAAPKPAAPKAETPKAETPKAETPKAEAPKVETPKVETPKAETQVSQEK